MGDVKFAGAKLLDTLGLGALVTWGFILVFGEISFWGTTEPDEYLTVEALYFQDGHFYQRISTSTGGFLQGQWSAEILDGGHYVCGGGGNGTYHNALQKFTADDWTYGDCSGLVEGREYRALASWRIDGVSGPEVTSRSFSFVFENPS